MKHVFRHIDICPAARVAFDSFVPRDGVEMDKYSQAARRIDHACGILQRGYALGSLGEHDHDDLLTQLEEAENLLEEIGVLEDHDYIREDLEPRAAELYDLDNVDVDDEADDLDAEESWLFGGSED